MIVVCRLLLGLNITINTNKHNKPKLVRDRFTFYSYIFINKLISNFSKINKRINTKINSTINIKFMQATVRL